MGQSMTKAQMDILNNVYQNQFSSIFQSASTKTSNYFTGQQTINFNVKGDVKCSGGFFISQKMALEFNYTTTVTDDMASDMKTTMENEINNKTSQTMKVVYDMLSSVGASHDDQTITNIQNRLTQITQKNVNTQAINQMIAETFLIQEITINIDGNLIVDAGVCQVNQDMQSKMVTTAIIKNVFTAAIQDSIISRIVNDASQKIDKEEKGLTALASALLWPLVVLIIAGAIFFGVTGKEGVKNISKPSGLITVFLIIVASLGLYLLWSKIRKSGPFKPKQYWGCEKNSQGFRTGRCVQYDDQQQGPFETEQLCVNAANVGYCDGFFGCEKDTSGYNTGKCVEFDTPLKGPYKNVADCNKAVQQGKACSQYWGCSMDKNGFNIPGNSCVQYTEQTTPETNYKDLATCEASRARGSCNQAWNCVGDKGKACQQTITDGEYTSQGECSVKCV